MPEYNSNLRALNDILGDYGLPGGHRFEVDALNALAVHLGGAGGHHFNIGALNEIVGLVEGSGTFQFEIDAYNEISRALGGPSNFQFVEDALSAISDLPVFDADTTPNLFVFTDVTDADLDTVYESNAIVVSGIDGPSPMTVVGGQYQVNGGAWASTATSAVDGDSVKVKRTSSSEYETPLGVTLTIGGVSDTFTITTAAEGGGGEPEALTLNGEPLTLNSDDLNLVEEE